MTPEVAQKLKLALPKMPEHEQQNILALLDEYEGKKQVELAQSDFMTFVHTVWPSFIDGPHHKRMAQAFEKVARGEIKRLIINMPPRHTKSEFASYLLPAWFLGNFPAKKVIQTSHTAELAVGFGRKVRNLVDSDIYRDIFPEVGLRADSQAAGRWNTNKGGDYFAIGVGGAVTGKGADLLIIDDPHSEQEAALSETNPEIYDKTYEWYTSGPRQRLQPGGAIVIVMCMTGDTPVLMADGSEKYLRDLHAGDWVATFDEGKLSVSKVTNWRSSGVDRVFTVQTQSGRILRANERHPFLVMNEGVLEWTRLKHLKVGDLLVSLKGATGPQKQKQNPANVALAGQKKPITKNTPMRRINQLATTVSGKVLSAPAAILSALRACAASVTTTNTRLQSTQQSKNERDASNTGTELPPSNTWRWLKNAKTVAISAVKNLLPQTHAHTGTASCVSTTATKLEKLEDYYAMTATLQSDMEKHQPYLNELQRISDFTADPIVAISYDGQEEVFDVEIARTENFIANGFVSHNTRWSKKDLTGQVIKAAAQRSGEEWTVIEFPALLPSGRPLWPQFWSQKELDALKAELPHSKWMAQYQQDPTSDVSAIIKREWWQQWEKDDPPPIDFCLHSWDTAFLKTERADYSACTTWGVFYIDDDTGTPQANIILLNSFKARMEFPELKQEAMRHYQEWQPDSLIVEAKAAGAPLIFELRAQGIPVQEFTPSKGNDKIARLNAVADIFASGRVWIPNTNWAEELVEEVASFPSGEHDDLVDSMSAALLRFRKGGFIRLQTDYQEDIPGFKSTKGKRFYSI
jgi:predicted phage terminase large subunit-like protein